MTKNILYIGRFQPFHMGHADAVRQIFQKFSHEDIHLFIGIGSAENNFLEKNPLTAGERFQIIRDALLEMGIAPENFSILPIRNIDHYALWPYHVQQLMPPIDIFFSGSLLVKTLWKQSFPNTEIFALEQREKISGTVLREKLRTGDTQNIQKFLLPSVLNNIKKIGLAKRLQKMKTDF